MNWKSIRNDIFFVTGLALAFWFVWAGTVWVYWLALVIGYPAGLLSLLFWFFIRNENKKRTKLIPIVLGIGLMLSLGILVVLLLSN